MVKWAFTYVPVQQFPVQFKQGRMNFSLGPYALFWYMHTKDDLYKFYQK